MQPFKPRKHGPVPYGFVNGEVLRAESDRVKECATDSYFKGLTVAATLLTGGLGAVKAFPWVAFAAIPISYLLGAIGRILVHKYTTSNRINGYELHQSRIIHLTNSSSGWHREMSAKMSWEEGLRAWRVVQPTVFKKLFYMPPDKRMGFDWKKNFSWRDDKMWIEQKLDFEEPKSPPTSPNPRSPYRWWDAGELAKKGGNADYYAGGYVDRLLRLLNRMQYATLMLFIAGIIAICINTYDKQESTRYATTNGDLDAEYDDGGKTDSENKRSTRQWSCNTCERFWEDYWREILIVTLMLGTGYWRLCRVIRIGRELKRRCGMLEGGFLSIESCAVMWQAVTLAHFRSLAKSTPSGLVGYTTHLGREAVHLKDRIGQIHSWTQNPDGTPTDKSYVGEPNPLKEDASMAT